MPPNFGGAKIRNYPASDALRLKTTMDRIDFNLRYPDPDFKDLPWNRHLSDWAGICDRLEDAPSGVHRHPVLFVSYSGILYALKELPGDTARREYELLCQAEELHIPAVQPVGYVQIQLADSRTSVLITRYLEGSLPYWILLSRQSFELYRSHLLNAMAGLMVEIHLRGLFWGDCSLSNTLFRRDAGALRAYVVDMETAEYQPGHTRPTLRFHDLQIMEENIDAELLELQHEGVNLETQLGVPAVQTGVYIRISYQNLWEEVTREDILLPDESYRIQERVRALNRLGFSVGDMDLVPSGSGSQVLLRVFVGDRHFHHDQLYGLTGLDVEEGQAQKMMNEIQEVRANLSNDLHRNVPLAAAAQHWLINIYKPVADRLASVASQAVIQAELYCQVLEHKWYLSERARHDVGHLAATEDYLKTIWVQRRMDL